MRAACQTLSAGHGAKMGLDATKPLVYPEHVFTKVRVPGEDSVDLARDIVEQARVDLLGVVAP